MQPTGKHREILRCPNCGERVTAGEHALACTNCPETIPLVDGIPYYPVDQTDTTFPTLFDVISPIYETQLWFPTVYRVIGGPFAPEDDRDWLAAALDADDDLVLDVACGTGRFSRYVAPDAEDVWGIDVAERMLQLGRRYLARDDIDNVQFVRMGVENLSFDTRTFDSVCCGWAIHLFPDRKRSFEEMSRVLRPGGTFVGTTILDAPMGAVPGLGQWAKKTTGLKPFTRPELRSMLIEAGFEAPRIERSGLALFFETTATE